MQLESDAVIPLPQAPDMGDVPVLTSSNLVSRLPPCFLLQDHSSSPPRCVFSQSDQVWPLCIDRRSPEEQTTPVLHPAGLFIFSLCLTVLSVFSSSPSSHRDHINRSPKRTRMPIFVSPRHLQFLPVSILKVPHLTWMKNTSLPPPMRREKE